MGNGLENEMPLAILTVIFWIMGAPDVYKLHGQWWQYWTYAYCHSEPWKVLVSIIGFLYLWSRPGGKWYCAMYVLAAALVGWLFDYPSASIVLLAGMCTGTLTNNKPHG